MYKHVCMFVCMSVHSRLFSIKEILNSDYK